MKTEQFTLSNGIKVILIKCPKAKIISTNVLVAAGGRYETKETYGLSHFLEHMVFKGTEKYPTAKKFSKRIESIGGISNAYTCEDHTSYWNIVPDEYSKLAFEMLSQLVVKPLLLEKEMSMERNVIIEEIRMVNDDPFIFMMHNINRALWNGHPMECDVLGPEKNIRKISRKNFTDYMEKYYVSNNMIISVAGDFDFKKIKNQLEKAFSIVKNGPKEIPCAMDVKQNKPNLFTYQKDLNQSHAVFAYKTLGNKDKDRYALKILSSILGGGMSSRLFEEVRDKRGLAYTVRTISDNFSDTGFLSIYGGFNLEKTHEALEAIQNVIDESKNTLYTNEVADTKKYLKGIIYYLLDGTERVSNRYGRSYMFTPEEIDPETIIKKIEAVTPEDVKRVANRIFTPKNKSLLVLSPFKDEEKFDKILNR